MKTLSLIALLAATTLAQAAPNQPPAGAPYGSTPAGTYAPNGATINPAPGQPAPPAPAIAIQQSTGGCDAECMRVNRELAANPNYYDGFNRSNSLAEIRARLMAEWLKHPQAPGFVAKRQAVWAARDATQPASVNKDHSLINIGISIHNYASVVF